MDPSYMIRQPHQRTMHQPDIPPAHAKTPPASMGSPSRKPSAEVKKNRSYGLLNADPLGRTSSQTIGRGVLYLCLLQLVCSLAVLYASIMYLYAFSSATGTILGGLLCFMSIVGMIGSSLKARNILNVYLVGTLLIMILCFHFVSEVQREVNVDCAMAEIDIRLEQIEETVENNAQTSMFTALVTRLDEMDEMMDMVEAKTKAIAESDPNDEHMDSIRSKKEKEHQMKIDDFHFLQGRLDQMREHAIKVIESSQSLEALEDAISQEERDRLENRLEAAEEVFHRIEDMEGEGLDHELDIEDYKALLKALTSATVEVNNLHKKKSTGQVLDAKPLYRQMSEIKEVGKVLERTMADAYGDEDDTQEVNVVYESPETRKRREDLEARRDEFRKDFEKLIVENYYELPGSRSAAALEDMPEHCLMESSARDILSYSAIVLLGLQLGSAYLVLSLLFRIPVKVD